MRRVFVLFYVAFVGLVVIQTGHVIYMHFAEFGPAARRWHEANDRGDAIGKQIARDDELEAHRKTFDLTWWMPK